MITNPWFWLVIAAAACVYWLFPRVRDWTLIVASGSFIGWSDWRSAVAVAVLSIFAFGVGRRAAVLPKWVVGVAVAVVLAFLAAYKYALGAHAGESAEAARGAAEGVVAVVPLGASYFTFKLVHYLVDSRRRQLPPHDRKTFLGYMFFLPMFAAGPIERFDDYVANRATTLTKAHVAEAGSRILYGLIKKMVLVDVLLDKQRSTLPASWLAAVPFVHPPCTVDVLLSQDGPVHPAFAWQFVIHRFTLWYLDFSAYSDVAVGVALFFGVRLVENFDWPILAANPTVFWKRYHASLSAWCQRYVYFPVMGRTRNPYLAVYATMIVMGLWHGASLNYVAWGIYQATVLSLYVTWTRVKRRLRWKSESQLLVVAGTVATVLLASVSSVFASTNARGLRAALRLLALLFGIHV